MTRYEPRPTPRNSWTVWPQPMRWALCAAVHVAVLKRWPAKTPVYAAAFRQERWSALSELETPVQPDDAVWIRINNLLQADKADAQQQAAVSPPFQRIAAALRSALPGGAARRLWAPVPRWRLWPWAYGRTRA